MPIYDVIIQIIYDSLTSMTIAFIGMFIPFASAYWLYKRTIKSNAELKIFEIGREISGLLHSASAIKSPMELFGYSYIDDNLFRVKEQNRDIAIHELLKKVLFSWDFERDELSDLDESTRANIIISIITDRFKNLAPSSVKWSGRGGMYSSIGEEITVDDQLFPFGTKLYRMWIDQFSLLYNDIWMFFSALERQSLVDIFSKNNFPSGYHLYGFKITNKWINNVETVTNEIRNFHSKLITQVQIIDNTVEEKKLNTSLIICFFYIIILSSSGYFLPRLFFKMEILSMTNLLSFSLLSFILTVMVIYRLLSPKKTSQDIYEKRKYFLSKLKIQLKGMQKEILKYKYFYIDNVLSMSSELKLSNSFIKTLSSLSKNLKDFNEVAQTFSDEMNDYLTPLKMAYNKSSECNSSFSIPLQKIPDKDFELDNIFMRINNTDKPIKFNVSFEEHHKSRSVFSISLSDLSSKQKDDLCNDIINIRSNSSDMECFKRLNALQKKIMKQIELIEHKIDTLTE